MLLSKRELTSRMIINTEAGMHNVLLHNALLSIWSVMLSRLELADLCKSVKAVLQAHM